MGASFVGDVDELALALTPMFKLPLPLPLPVVCRPLRRGPVAVADFTAER